jgi:GDP-4-dehydro-6-deoxy-D-mannose reductase
LENGNSGEVYNICSGIGYTLYQIINMIAEILHIKVHTNVEQNKIRPSDNKIIVGNNGKIIRETGWKPTIDFIQSLQDVIDWWMVQIS